VEAVEAAAVAGKTGRLEPGIPRTETDIQSLEAEVSVAVQSVAAGKIAAHNL